MKDIREITIIGFGNQAKAWAMNLRDSGFKVYIGLRENSNSLALVNQLQFESFDFDKEEIPTKNFVLLIPDDQHFSCLTQILKNSFNKGKNCILGHGYSFIKDNLKDHFPEIDFSLLAPKSIASELRFLFETKGEIGAFYHSNSTEVIKDISKALGVTHLFEANFKEEMEADLFSEQSILCSVIPYTALETFNFLVAKGIPSKLAYYECFYEIKLITDTLLKYGPEKFFEMISPNALIGAQKGKEILLNDQFKNSLGKIFSDIKSGSFFEEIDRTDIVKLKEEVSLFWKGQKLNQEFNEIRGTK